MARWRIGNDSANFLVLSLAEYAQELRELLNQVRQAANLAGLDPAEYLPGEVEEELESANHWANLLARKELRDERALFGVEVSAEIGAVFASARSVKREDLMAEFLTRTRDPLTPQAAKQPLFDRIQRIDVELHDVWSQFGQSPCLQLVRVRRLLKRTGQRGMHSLGD